MDREGYETGAGYGHGTTGTHKPMGQTIKESIPGTHEYQATHGVDRAHQNVEQLKSHIPGTEEHRMRDVGVAGPTGDTGTGYGYTGDVGHGYHETGYDQGHTGKPMGQTIKESIPGTREYEATNGMTGSHRMAEQAKVYIPGTEEHRISQATNPTGGYSSAHTQGHTAGYSDRAYEHDATHTGTGGMGTTGMMGTGMGTTGTTGTGMAGEGKSMGQKIKEVIPGTREHEAKKMAEGRF